MFACIMVLVLSMTLVAEQITLTAVADTSLWQRETNHNLGGTPFLPAGNVGSDGNFSKTRMLVKFDLVGALPEGAIVQSASVYLRVVRAPDPAKLSRNSTFMGRRVLKNWGEGNKIYTDPQTPMTSTLQATAGEATWDHRFAGDPSGTWAMPGGDFTDNDFAEAEDFDFFSSQTADRDVESPLNAEGLTTIKDWLTDSSSNFGWVIKSELTSGGTARQFASREYSIPEHRPQLSIVYATASPEILSIGKQEDSVTIDYTAEKSVVYRPQYKDSLTTPEWEDFPDQIPLGADGVQQIFDDVTGVDERYYRVIIP